jgi:catechol 2,3-dioxygenase-like lactoylglutathione lyase family enzyme
VWEVTTAESSAWKLGLSIRTTAETMEANEILETCLYVDDLEAAEEFYARVLGLRLLGRQQGRHVFFQCGKRMLLLFNPQQSSHSDSDFPVHGATGAGHVCFAVRDAEIDAWQQHLEDCGVAIEMVYEWPSGARSVYFRDPAGNSLEVASPRIWGIEEDGSLGGGSQEEGTANGR